MRKRLAVFTAGAVMAAGSLALVTTPTTAAPPKAYKDGGNRAMGNGLGRLVQDSTGPQQKASGSGQVRLDQSKLAIRDDQGRVMVQLTPQQGVNRADFRKQAEAQGLEVVNVDAASGTLEGFVPLDKANALAALKGTGTIAQTIKPTTHIGKATSQGVALQRADKVQAKGITGKGITVGALSDSFDTAAFDALGEPLKVHAAQDVKSGDLPGKGNAKYPTPVVNLEDYDDPETASDEGRAMLQIVHDVAPAAKLCFATAFNGEIGFADNIRRLGAKTGKCKANVIVDDVSYFSEPMFSDGLIGDAVDDVAKQGVHYYSSAGNSGEAQSWEAGASLVPASAGLRGSNLDFSKVAPELYTGGLQDFKAGAGVDVSQSVAVGPGGGLFNLQWDDPVDLDGATFGAPYFSDDGAVTDADPEVSFEFTPTQAQLGKTVQFRTDAIPTGTTDLILSVDAPDGSNLAEIDTGSSPEVFSTTLSQAGTYTITISGFGGDTGDFTVDVRPVITPSRVTTDYNVLIFAPEGGYIGSVADLNPLSGRPQELGFLDGLDVFGEVQLVIARAGTGPVKAPRLRNILNGDVYFTEHNDPLAPATFGHSTAAGATSVGAYDPFKSYLPEFFTSPGGDLKIYFDSEGNRYSQPRTRRVPLVSGADGGNTTFFVVDNARDPDTLPNFFGTSASAPHVAAIAALVLQKQGGPTSLTPAQMRNRLKGSTFNHDLDPNHAAGTAGGLTISADGPQGYEQDVVPGPMNDPRFFTVRYSGAPAIKAITFYGETASPTALGSTAGKSDGIVFDPRPFGEVPFRDNGFPFTVGSTSGGLARSAVTARFSVPGTGEAGPRQYSRLTLNFANNLEQGEGLQFGIDRDLAISGYGGANEGNGADELGGAIFLPQGTGSPNGMKFVATLANGKTVTGFMKNRLGEGFTALDGYGVVNAAGGGDSLSPPQTTTQVRLARRPEGEPDDETFSFVTVDLPELEDGQLLLRVVYLSLDPYMRGRMSDAKSYAAPVEVGAVIVGGTVCVVEESRHPSYDVGEVVLSYSGWQTHAISDGSDLRRLDPARAPITTALGVLGMPGLTAYAGLLEIGKPQPGETVVVAAATGPVGSAVGQIARIKGARAVGIAGGEEKRQALLDEFGFDAALDHRSPTFADDLAAATPGGVDVYFENVSGSVGRAVLSRMNLYGRVPVCGLVADYNGSSAAESVDRLPGFMRLVLTRSLRVRGFIQTEFVESHGRDFLRDMGGWIADGSVRYREDVVDGLEAAPEAFRGMLRGRNFGKVLVRVSDDPRSARR